MPWSQDALTSQHRCGTKCIEFFQAGTHAQASASRDYVGASLQRHGCLIQCHMVVELKDSRLTDSTRTNLYLSYTVDLYSMANPYRDAASSHEMFLGTDDSLMKRAPMCYGKDPFPEVQSNLCAHCQLFCMPMDRAWYCF